MREIGVRVGSVVEWVVAAAFLAATVAVASLIVAAIGTPRRPAVVVAAATPGPALPLPAVVPPGAVSVPVLPFQDGREIRVGETAAAVAARLGRAAELGPQEVERAPLGDRLTRFYEYAGSRFILVYEPAVRNGEPRIAAIYLP